MPHENRKTSNMLLAYIRHGQPIYNPDSLTPEGHIQADAISKRLAKFGIDRVFASSSNRALQTAQPTAKACGKEIEILDWLNEGHAWENGSVVLQDGKNRRFGFQVPECLRKFLSPEVVALGARWHEHPSFSDTKFHDYIPLVDFEVDRFIESLGYVHDRENHIYHPRRPSNDHIAVFAHEGMGGFFLSSLLDIPYPLFASHFFIGWSTLSLISFNINVLGDVVPLVQTLGNDSHLYREGLSTMQQNNIEY